MLDVFLVHGFRSNCLSMLEYFNAYKKDKIHFQTNVQAHNWNAGETESGFESIMKTIFSGQKYGDKTISQWDNALDNIENSSIELAKKINESKSDNPDILLVAHSMGTEVVKEAIDLIDEDKNIYLFLSGGISESFDYEYIFDKENVKLGYNFYSTNDFILEKFLPEINIVSDSPIGLSFIEHEKVKNIKTSCSHSEYSTNSNVIKYYTGFIRHLVEKKKGSYLVWSN